jgi:hypothetical protein
MHPYPRAHSGDQYVCAFTGLPCSVCWCVGAPAGSRERSALAEHLGSDDEAGGDGPDADGAGAGGASGGIAPGPGLAGVAAPSGADASDGGGVASSAAASAEAVGSAGVGAGGTATAGADGVRYREAVGRAAKTLIDAGRQVFLRSLFPTHTVTLVQYCALTDSLENRLLLAVPEPSGATVVHTPPAAAGELRR